MAVAPIGHLDLNTPGLLGREQKEEIRRLEGLTGSLQQRPVGAVNIFCFPSIPMLNIPHVWPYEYMLYSGASMTWINGKNFLWMF